MSRVVTRRILAYIACGGMLSAAALSPAPHANASPVQDAAFLAAIQSAGITYASASRIITGAHTVCTLRDNGLTELEVAAKVLRGNDVTPYQAGYFVGASEAAYCPEWATGGTSNYAASLTVHA